jgi:uncharacterized membrane protein
MTDPSLPAGRFTPGDFRVGNVLSRSWSVFWRNILKFSLVTGIAALGSQLLPGGAGVGPLDFTELVRMLPLYVFAQAVIYYAALQHMRKRPVSLGEGLTVILGRFLPLISLGVIGVLVVSGLMVIEEQIQFSLGYLPTTVLAALSYFILLLTLFAMVMVTWSMAGPVCVVERAGVFRSLGRSRELTRGHRWKILGLLLLVLVAGLIVDSRVDAIMGAAAGFDTTVSQTVESIWDAIWAAFFAVIVAVIYHDLRVAKEGVVAALFE